MASSRTANKFERRSDLMAAKLIQRVNLLTNALGGSGQRPPFTKQLSNKEALTWWRANYDKPTGKSWLSQMDIQSRMELDRDLARANESDMLNGGLE
jgi:hypothetical protein